MSSHQAATEPLLPQHQQQNSGPPSDADDGPDDAAAAGRLARSVRWIMSLGFVLFTLICVMDVYCYPGRQHFIFVPYVNLLALIVCLKRYEKAEPGSQLRDGLKLKVAIWLLAMALALLFSYYMVAAAVVHPAVAVAGCLTAVGVVAGVLYHFFPPT
ncbi:hypothetical protein EJB05_24815, partial [Eragrostis curvula]